MADACLIFGFVLLILGVALLSVPGACMVAGALLLLAGAQGYRRG